jgi:two-component system, OmpR family, osmolarity sensor histidine kinase EnvZ
VNWLPKTLFGRLALLVLAVIVTAQALTWVAFSRDRANMLARQFSDTKIAQIQALRTALSAVPRTQRAAPLLKIGEEYGAIIVPVDRRPEIGTPPRSARFNQIATQLQEALGEKTEIRLGQREGEPIVWLRLLAGEQYFWAGFRLESSVDEVPERIVVVTALMLIALLGAAYVFARRAAQPLRALASAADAIGRGQPTPPVPETGPAEIVAVSRGFNAMRENLEAIEKERAVMLAGVSHDIRTPLTRLKLEIEMAGLDAGVKQAMSLDLEEIERTVGQFLDFARTESDLKKEMIDVDMWLSERYEMERMRRGEAISLSLTPVPPLHGHRPSLDRAVANLVDNAIRYGSPTVEIKAFQLAQSTVIEVADRGPGIKTEDIDRLLRPFTRGEAARTDASGAGLGLAIVERIARLHGGALTLTSRAGGGTLAQIALPAA